MRQFLAGKKTYLVAAGAAVTATISYADGGLDDQAFIGTLIGLVLAATLRSGSKADATAAVEGRKPE